MGRAPTFLVVLLCLASLNLAVLVSAKAFHTPYYKEKSSLPLKYKLTEETVRCNASRNDDDGGYSTSGKAPAPSPVFMTSASFMRPGAKVQVLNAASAFTSLVSAPPTEEAKVQKLPDSFANAEMETLDAAPTAKFDTLAATSTRNPTDAVLTTNREYTIMYWANGLRNLRQIDIGVQTSRYSMRYKYNTMELKNFGLPKNYVSEAAAINTYDVEYSQPASSMALTLTVGSTTYRVTGNNGDVFGRNILIEHGRWLSRRKITGLTWSRGAPVADSSFQIVAWPDRLQFVLTVVSSATIKGYTSAGVSFAGVGLDHDFNAATSPWGKMSTFYQTVSGRSLKGCTASVSSYRITKGYTLVAILSLRFDKYEQRLKSTNPIYGVYALQTVPMRKTLSVSYDHVTSASIITLRTDDQGNLGPERWNRIERVAVRLVNSSPSNAIARLIFEKRGVVFLIAGLSAMITKTDYTPFGVPVQISKNWDSSVKWYRAIVQLPIPRYSEYTVMYTGIGAFWGGKPAASHAQLQLTYQPFTQWEQTALGSWAEAFCYEPDQGLKVRSAVLDSRGLYIVGGDPARTKYGWPTNVGGADVAVYYQRPYVILWNNRMKTYRKRTGPVLTEVTHSGRAQDGSYRLQYTTSIHQTDDLARAVYNVRLDVTKNMVFNRFVFFQAAGQGYSFGYDNDLAYGNEFGLQRTWQAQPGTSRKCHRLRCNPYTLTLSCTLAHADLVINPANDIWNGAYRFPLVELKNRYTWFSMTGAPRRPGDAPDIALASRGWVLRDWVGKVNGRYVNAWFSERGIISGATAAPGGAVSVLEITHPPGTTTMRPGDYVQFVVEQVVLPKYADDYFGTNGNLRSALSRMQDSWRLMERYAQGNYIQIRVSTGRLIRARPILIQVTNNRAVFSLNGGVGYSAITFTGVTGYDNPILQIQNGRRWSTINQAVNGKDFWQTEFDYRTGTFDVTYSISLDTRGDRRITRVFQFFLAGKRANFQGVQVGNAAPVNWPNVQALQQATRV
eukprot:jgi/Chlat1/805/Chrsp104S01265